MNNEIIQINETTWRIEDGFVRFFLLTGRERALLIDTGATSPDAKEIAESLTDLPLMLLNTHADGDHISGNAAFSEFYMHPDDYKNLNVAEKVPGSKLLPLHDGDVIDLGGRPLEIITIPGHTYGSVAVLDVKGRVLFPGDSAQDGHIYMFGSHRSPAQYPRSLQKLIDMEDRFDFILPCHSTPVLPASQIRKVLAAWNEVVAGSDRWHPDEINGNRIRTYDLDDCGFFCDPDLTAKRRTNMEITKTLNENSLLLVLEGRLDTTTAPQLESELKDSLDAVTELTLDFTSLEYISSAGLRVLLSAQKAMNGKAGKMIVRNVNEDILEVFEITGFTEILTIE